MSIVSFGFLGFLAAAMLLYYLVPGKYRWMVLLAASYGFYLLASVKGALFLLAATGITFLTALALEGQNGKQKAALAGLPIPEKAPVKAAYVKKKRWITAAGLTAVFGMLFAVKYLNFTLQGLGGLIGRELPGVSLLLPLGISFYTFQSAGYVFDVYRGKCPADHNFFQYALFVSFFPQIIQGPISRHGEIAEQLYSPHTFDFPKVESAVYLMLWGYLKKMVIADRLLTDVARAFNTDLSYTGLAALAGAAMYCLEIYADFSGGIDICRGAAACFGVTLPENFRRPFFARSLNEFWQRWHITLGRWMREYVFYPMAISKPMARLSKRLRARSAHLAKAVPTCIASFTVFLIVGIWHGAAARFIAFGLYFGVLICASTLLEPLFARVLKLLKIPAEGKLWHGFQVFRTCLLCFTGFFFARADRLADGVKLIGRMLAGPLIPAQWPFTMSTGSVIVLLAACLLLLAVSLLRERNVEIRGWILQRPYYVRWGIVLLLVLVLLVLGVYGPGYNAADFIYMGF